VIRLEVKGANATVKKNGIVIVGPEDDGWDECNMDMVGCPVAQLCGQSLD